MRRMSRLEADQWSVESVPARLKKHSRNKVNLVRSTEEDFVALSKNSARSFRVTSHTWLYVSLSSLGVLHLPNTK